MSAQAAHILNYDIISIVSHHALYRGRVGGNRGSIVAVVLLVSAALIATNRLWLASLTDSGNAKQKARLTNSGRALCTAEAHVHTTHTAHTLQYIQRTQFLRLLA